MQELNDENPGLHAEMPSDSLTNLSQMFQDTLLAMGFEEHLIGRYYANH